MEYEFWTYIIALLTSTALTTIIGGYLTLKSRNAKLTPYFLLMLLLIDIWSLGTVLETVTCDFPEMSFWNKMQYICFCYLPVIIFILSAKFTGHNKWVGKNGVSALLTISSFFMLLVLTNDYHGWIRYNEHLDFSGAFPVICKAYGPGFYALMTYSYVLLITALLLFIHAGFIKKTISPMQSGCVLSGVGILLFSNILYTSGLSPITEYDITPALIGPADIIIIVGVLYHRLFELMPIARDVIIETMQSGIIVLDLDNTVMDTNAAFNKMLGSASKTNNKKVEEVCGRIPQLLEACVNWDLVHCEFSVENVGQTRVYEAYFSLLYERNHLPVGRLAVIHEITARKLEEEARFRQQQRLAVVEEKQRLARNLHDDLGQVLGFINLQAQGIQRELAMAGIATAADKLDKLANASQMAHGEIRKYIRNARETVNYEEDFQQDLENEILVFEDITGISVLLDLRIDALREKIPRDKQFHIFNILRESLNNIRKHARASQVKISFEQLEDKLVISVADDGTGFDLAFSRGKQENHFGLAIMRERAQEIGATLEIKSTLGRGTEIQLSFPLMEGQKNGQQSVVSR